MSDDACVAIQKWQHPTNGTVIYFRLARNSPTPSKRWCRLGSWVVAATASSCLIRAAPASFAGSSRKTPPPVAAVMAIFGRTCRRTCTKTCPAAAERCVGWRCGTLQPLGKFDLLVEAMADL